MSMHRNSMDAWLAFKPKASARAREIMDEIIRRGSGTDRQLLQRLNRGDMNEVRPTITRLVQMGCLKEITTAVCAQTGQTVRVVGVVPHGPAVGWPDTQNRKTRRSRDSGTPGLFPAWGTA